MAVVVATSACPVKRTRHPPGFYRALHNRSTADVLVVDRDQGREHGKLSVRENGDLPEGCYGVERLVSKRRRKVRPLVAFLHPAVDWLKP